MKIRVLSFLGIFAATLIVPAAFYGLSAQELWNSRSEGQPVKKDNSPSYYNGKKKGEKDEKPALYNTNRSLGNGFAYSQSSMLHDMIIGLKSPLSIDTSAPFIFSMMSRNALKNRMSDTEVALQRIEEQRKKYAPIRAKNLRDADIQKQKNDFEYAQQIRALKEQKKAEREARDKRHEDAYKMAMANGGEFTFDSENAFSSGRKTNTYYDTSSSRDDEPRTNAFQANESSEPSAEKTRSSSVGGGGALYNKSR